MFRQTACVVATLALAVAAPTVPSFAATPAAAPSAAGVLRLRSDNSFDETVARLKADVQAKGIRYSTRSTTRLLALRPISVRLAR